MEPREEPLAAANGTIEIESDSRPAASENGAEHAPDDGAIPQGLVTTPDVPRVVMNGLFLDQVKPGTGETQVNPTWVQFSGLSPNYPGVWQINVQIPTAIPPSATTGTQIAIVMQGLASYDANSGFTTIFYVK